MFCVIQCSSFKSHAFPGFLLIGNSLQTPDPYSADDWVAPETNLPTWLGKREENRYFSILRLSSCNNNVETQRRSYPISHFLVCPFPRRWTKILKTFDSNKGVSNSIIRELSGTPLQFPSHFWLREFERLDCLWVDCSHSCAISLKWSRLGIIMRINLKMSFFLSSLIIYSGITLIGVGCQMRHTHVKANWR